MSTTIEQLRGLIVEAAPDPAKAVAVRTCGEHELLDSVIPFSSVIVLGMIVAVEEHWGVTIARPDLARALEGGATLARLAVMVDELLARSAR